ncbi:hypothetical protein, partial [Priestia megaterium]|uniref:hypothetical protein n=1 Tax=Priestia megaterium TaxID=1404 RepID=UPI0030084B26
PLEIVNGKLEATNSYTEAELCVECNIKVGEYFNDYDNPICAKFMVSDRKSEIGPKCGQKITLEYM